MEKNKTFEEHRKEWESRISNMGLKELTHVPSVSDTDQIIYDKCILCGNITPYPINLEIDLRHCYVEGAGQLCVDCCKKLNDKRL